MSHAMYLRKITSFPNHNPTNNHTCILYTEKHHSSHAWFVHNYSVKFPSDHGQPDDKEMTFLSVSKWYDSFLGFELEWNLEKHHRSSKPYSIIDESIDSPKTSHTQIPPWQPVTLTSPTQQLIRHSARSQLQYTFL